MIINFSSEITGFDGEPVQMNGRNMTIGMASAIALNNANGSPENAIERGLLAMRLFQAGEIDISPEESAMIRKELGVTLSPVIASQVYKHLS